MVECPLPVAAAHLITLRNLSVPSGRFAVMLIDCDTCLARDSEACDDCVVSVLFSSQPLEVDGEEQEALTLLADAGLVPRLRLLPPTRRAG